MFLDLAKQSIVVLTVVSGILFARFPTFNCIAKVSSFRLWCHSSFVKMLQGWMEVWLTIQRALTYTRLRLLIWDLRLKLLNERTENQLCISILIKKEQMWTFAIYFYLRKHFAPVKTSLVLDTNLNKYYIIAVQVFTVCNKNLFFHSIIL